MKALRFTDVDNYAVDDVEVPSIEEDEVLVAARSVGICHSDVELLEGRYIIPFQYPIIPGHEWAGEVVDVGRKVTAFDVGDRVVGECVIGMEHFGFSISGAAAEYFVAKESWLHALPDELSWTQGALVEPFSCGYYATVRAGNVDASDHAVVLGAGPIGLGVVAAATAKGAQVHVVDPSSERAELARRMGAVATWDPTEDGVEERLRDATDGLGGTAVFEASGNPTAMADALRLAAFRARVVFIGIDVGSEVAAPLGMIQSKELDIKGIIGSPGVWPQTLRFLANSGVDLTPVVTSQYELGSADDALGAVLGDRSQVKVHITSAAGA
ncbi:MAG TPA: zinc-binding dehydrogenase [Nitriliruptoraceae bacterium]|nr:zinc-binding dehydrogenase [Nitriliruptoraceae bacterium]